MPRHEPQRTCIVTRTVRPPHEMIRFVLDPEGRVVADLNEKLPGRGVWVTANRETVALAVRRRAFSKGLKAEAKASPTLPEEIDVALYRDLRQGFSLAKKAGAVVTGFAKVEAEIGGGGIAALVHAAEAAEDSRRKLQAALRRRFGDGAGRIPVIDDVAGDDLDLALGRSHVIHAALVAGAGSGGLLTRWRRLRIYRATDAFEAASPGDGRTDDIEPAGTRAE
ncbi:RNA-binding protein [Salinarimonas soli]|uniref:RNA-binding protein n=1 Tax=Salinarimonas soli TaxID=1638099 RepID=A0A5B2VDF8_9HYPH|nr:RNA-binding protein [Salinarimonas soli]KAA2236805.1 RNA-binding protein [Salinarimonas soli]